MNPVEEDELTRLSTVDWVGGEQDEMGRQIQQDVGREIMDHMAKTRENERIKAELGTHEQRQAKLDAKYDAFMADQSRKQIRAIIIFVVSMTAALIIVKLSGGF